MAKGCVMRSNDYQKEQTVARVSRLTRQLHTCSVGAPHVLHGSHVAGGGHAGHSATGDSRWG